MLFRSTRSGSAVRISDIAMYGSKGDLVGKSALQSLGLQGLSSGVRVAGNSGLTGHEVEMTVFYDENGAIGWRIGP